MAKDNLYDSALSGIEDILESVSNEIAKEFTGKSPFDKEEISQDETDYYLQQGLGGAEIEELRRRGR